MKVSFFANSAAKYAKGFKSFPIVVPKSSSSLTVGPNASSTRGPITSKIFSTIVEIKFNTFCPFSRAAIALTIAATKACMIATIPPRAPPFAKP